MNPLSGNFFALLTLIVAPAVLTNASSVLALNTANRFGRVVDRSRQLVDELERSSDDVELNSLRLRQVGRLRSRGRLLLRAQICFYAALGMFVGTALVSVIGAGLVGEYPIAYRVAGLMGLVVGASAAASLIYGCVMLVREVGLALQSLSEEASLLEGRARPAGQRA